MKASETPRTDAFEESLTHVKYRIGEDYVSMTNFARDLERTNAVLEKEVGRLKGELACIEEVRNKQPDHPDDERMWIPEMLRAKHKVTRLQGLVERAVVVAKCSCYDCTLIDRLACPLLIEWLKDAEEVEK